MEPTGVGVANLIGKIGVGVWHEWRADRSQAQLHADILEAAKLEFAEAKVVAAQIAAEVAGGNAELADAVERFVTLVPASIRASLRRPEDLTGKSLPAGYNLRDADDLVRLLPATLPRFKAGDAPDFLGGWELVRQLGAGGFGEVWFSRNGEDHSLTAAVKFGHPLSDAEHALLNEGDVLNRIRESGGHPGIFNLLDRRTRNVAVPWLRYEYVPGGDLSGLILSWQTLPPADRLTKALAALRELAGTVGHFHRLPGGAICHRDLKPSNILVAADGSLKIGDFGIGAISARRLLDGERRGTVSQTARLQSYLRGSHTPLYASTQQRAGSRDIDPRDDVHALGVIAYQMLTGHLDHGAGPDMADDLREHGVSDEVVTLLTRCVSGKLEKRPTDAQKLHDALRSTSVTAQTAHIVPPPFSPTRPAPRPNPAAVKQLTVASTLIGHSSGVSKVAFSPDGRLVATASGDATARLWDAATGSAVRTLEGHANGVSIVAFSPDGRLVATASYDGTARLWDAATGAAVRTLEGHSGGVRCVAFSPDGWLVATSSDDGTARLWQLIYPDSPA